MRHEHGPFIPPDANYLSVSSGHKNIVSPCRGHSRHAFYVAKGNRPVKKTSQTNGPNRELVLIQNQSTEASIIIEAGNLLFVDRNFTHLILLTNF